MASLVPGRVAAQVNCTQVTDTDLDFKYINADLSGYWIESLEPGSDLVITGFDGPNGTGANLFANVLSSPPYQYVIGSYPLMQSLSYTANDIPSDFQYCQYGPGTPTPAPPTITPTELVFPTETATNTPTITSTPNYPALILEQEQRTFQWLYFALIVLGSMGVLLIAMRR